MYLKYFFEHFNEELVFNIFYIELGKIIVKIKISTKGT